MRSVLSRVIAVAAVALVMTASVAAADPVKCSRTIAKEAAKLRATTVKALQKCKDSVITKGVPATLAECPDATQAGKIMNAGTKMSGKIFNDCGGADKVCGTPDDEPLASIHWDSGACMGVEGQCDSILISDCGHIAGCQVCLSNLPAEEALDTLLYDGFEDANFFPNNGIEPQKSRQKCQTAIAKSGAKFLIAKEKILNKCWDAKLNGKVGFADGVRCPDTDPNPGSGAPPASPGDNKTVEAIKKAEQKKVAAICKACGAGGDADKNGICDAPPGFALDDIVENVPFDCPDVEVPPNAVHPSGQDCDAIAVNDLQSYIECLDCVLEYKADCLTDAGVGDGAPAQGIDYPSECNPVPLPNCPSPPTRYEFTANGSDADYDVGWTGIGHDQPISTSSRLTLAVSDCLGSMTGCGECTLDGPIVNVGGAAFANRRCTGVQNSGGANGQNGSWIQCTNDSQCPGTDNRCTYYFGPPQPQGPGGLPFCATNEMVGPFSGTIDSDTGAVELTGAMRTRVFPGATDNPCPRCIAGVCNGGQRNGQSCVVSGTSALFGDDVSYDCPPLGANELSTSDVPIRMSFSTGTQTRTISAASPGCRAPGFGGFRCQCDTCDDLASTPCASNADCAPGGICGGLRCLVDSATPGTPCSNIGQNTDPVCGQVGPGACQAGTCAAGPHVGSSCVVDDDCGGTCGVPGALTRPNDCSNGVCVAGGGPDDGQCQINPTDQMCNIETFRGCTTTSDCNPPGCPSCTPGQTCVAKRRECFTDNGSIGGSAMVTGVASTTAPTLGTFACYPPAGAGILNGVYGFPGLMRTSMPGTSTIN